MGPKNIGAAVKELRDARGKTQMDLAVELKLGISTVQRYEKGERVDIHTVARFIAQAREIGKPDIAKLLRAAMIDYLGPEIIGLISEKEADSRNGNAKPQATIEGQVHKRRLSA